MSSVSTPMVILMGMCTVFVVLISLILIITIMGKIMGAVTAKQKAAAPAPAAAAPSPVAAAPVGNKQQLVAVMAAVIAEDMGTDVGRIKIHSIRKL